MSALDPRLLLSSGPAAAQALEGVLAAASYVAPEPMQAIRAVLPIRRSPAPHAEQLDELLFGERFEVLERRDGWGLGQASRDGYVGWARLDGLAGSDGLAPTHRVSALGAHAFAEPSIKAAPLHRLSLNALVRGVGREGRFVHVAGGGWVVEAHLAAIGGFESDPAAVAERFLHTPYLWGGRSSEGLDCSGLVQQALYACGRAAPRDSDQQARLGRELAPPQLARGDLVFWPGHVGMMLNPTTLIHANAHHMAVTAEPLADTCERIAAATGAGPTAWRRLTP